MKARITISGFGRLLLSLSLLLVQLGSLGQIPAQAAETGPVKALAANNLNSVSTLATQATAPVPVLLVYNDSFTGNVFSKFLGEIMKAEGFNLFDTAQLSAVSATTLSGYDTVVLAQTGLTGSQVTMFTQYVQEGGNLIAMRPDAQLANLMGLGTGAGTLNNGYMAIQTATSYGQGFVSDSLQLHTASDQYSGATAQKVALLYSNAGTATSFPAVTVNNFGNGKAAAFTYDLASSVVYIRQGNPSLADIDADGDSVTRRSDLYYNWIDLTKMALPQADIQQRLFGRLLSQFSSLKTPLPRFWYFPNAKSSVVVMTSDAHANPDSYFENLIASMNRYNVTTSFYGRYGPSKALLNTWLAQGYTYNIHPYKIGNPSLTAGYQEATDWYNMHYGASPTHSVRVHRLEGQGWVDGGKVAGSFGYMMDYSYYRYGAWLKRPDNSWVRGYMMGSSLPMKMIDQTGNIVNVFGQYTEIADDQMGYPGPENLSNDDSYTFTKQAIDTSVGGTYQPVIIQAHVDYYAAAQSWFESTMAYGRNLNLPFLNGDQWSDFTQHRYNSNFSNLSWTNNQLNFSTSIPAAQSGQTIMLPANTNTSNILGVKVNGITTAFTTSSISGENFAMVTLPGGNSTVSVTYQPDTVPPEISNLTATPSGTQAQIKWATNELASSTVNYGLTNALGSTASTTGNTVSHAVQLAGLTAGQTYFYQVVSTDLSNNTATSATSTFVATNAAPTISQVTPATVLNNAATTLTITGANFVNIPTVLLGNQSLSTVTFNSTTNLTAVIPAGVTPGVYNLTVTNPDNASATLANSVTVKLPAPNLTTVSPNSASNNAIATITLNGTNFVSGADVRLGVTNLSGVTFVSAAKLTADVPSGLTQGIYDLTVTNPDGQLSTLPASFTVGPPASGPSISQVAPAVVTNTGSNTVTLSGANFTGPVTVALSGVSQSGATLVNSSTITFSLAANFTPGTYDVTVTNANNQSTTLPGGLVVLPQAVIQNTQATFAAGTLSNTLATNRLDGEIKLKADLEDYFAGTALNPGTWTSGTWASGGSATLNNGSLAVQGAYAHTLANVPNNRLEFKAKFASNTPNQHVGYSPDLNSGWILFSVPGFDTSKVYARSSVNGLTTDTPLNVSLNAFHDFLITIVPGSINFFVDGSLVATHNVTANNSSQIWLSNGTTAGALVVDSIQSGVYPASGTYLSTPLDAGQNVAWQKLNWQLNLPSTVTATVQARTSGDATNWSAWSSPATSAGDVALSLPTGRYLQYTLGLASNDPTQSPEVLSVAGVYGSAVPGPLARIAVTPATATLATGATQQFSAQGFDSNNVPLTGPTFSWSTRAGGTINPDSGLYTAGSVLGSYPNSVVATSGSITGTAGVTINPNPPGVTSVDPNTGSTNTATNITINGTNFVTGAAVKLGTTSLGGVTFVSAARLTAVVPSGLAQGVYDLTVTNPDNQSDTLAGAFTVGPPASGPTLTQVAPAVVSNKTANTITLSGTNFTAPVTVALSGSNVAGITVVDATTITFNLAAGFAPGSYDVKVTNGTGQSDTQAAGLVVLAEAVIQTTQANFATGTFSNTVATARLDGEIKLKADLEDHFAGSTLDTNRWTSGTWVTGGTNKVGGGTLAVAGAYAHTLANVPNNRLQFRAKFASNTPNQHIGYSPDLSSGWILFSVPGFDTARIYARSSVNGVNNDTPLTISLDTYHDFVINIVPGALQFLVDGTLVATHNVTVNNPSQIWLSNGTPGSPLVVDSIQSGVYPASGTYLSTPLDAGQDATWQKLNWQFSSPTGTTVSVQARTSPDATNWSAWSSSVTAAGDVPLSLPAGRYLQYTLGLASNDPTQSPEVLSVAGVYGPAVPGPLARIAVTPATATLATGATQQFSAQGFDSNNVPLTGPTFSWSTRAGGTINSTSGLYTAGNTGGTYPASVIASSGTITGSADVTVTASGPTVTAVSPASGSNSVTNTITITGTNFVATPTVTLGTTALTGVTLVSATNLTAAVPAGLAAGVYTLTVTNPDAQQASLANAYTSVVPAAPTVTAVSPVSGSNGVTNTLTITGTNFVSGAAVKLGTTTLANVTFGSSGSLTAAVPAGMAAGTYSLTVTNPDGQAGTLPDAYTVLAQGDTTPPTVSLTAPANGATVTGSAVTVSATATDTVGVVSVQFLLDGSPLGSPDTAAPYSITWDTTTITNGSHTLRAQARDAAGNIGTAPNVTITTANPGISAVTASSITTTGATINWTTNAPATTQVQYGPTTSYGSTTTLNSTAVTSHSQALSGLIPGTLYHYRVTSTNAANNTTTSGDFTFTTVALTALVGDTKIESHLDSNSAGLAEAFQYTATGSGTATRIYIYLDSTNTANTVVVGIYSNTTSENPGTLLVQATITNPVKGAWNSVSVPNTTLTTGTKYWIAVLGPVGAGIVRFRDTSAGGKAQTSAQTNLTSLPANWTTGTLYSDSPMSAYAG